MLLINNALLEFNKVETYNKRKKCKIGLLNICLQFGNLFQVLSHHAFNFVINHDDLKMEVYFQLDVYKRQLLTRVEVLSSQTEQNL